MPSLFLIIRFIGEIRGLVFLGIISMKQVAAIPAGSDYETLWIIHSGGGPALVTG